MSLQASSPALSDQTLAALIATNTAGTTEVLVVANGFTAVVASRKAKHEPWAHLGRGDFGLKCGAAADVLAKRRLLWWSSVSGSPLQADLALVKVKLTSEKAVQRWLKAAQVLTTKKGRGPGPKSEDLDEVGYLAAWRCQFSGCGKDLRRHAATGAPNRSSYFAHIIAASPNGPRGDPVLSLQRSAEIANILMLCDECHRRIDREDPDSFDVDFLRRMREQSIAEVRRLLTALQYPDALPVVIMGNVTGQSPHFETREAEEAMWTRRLRMTVGHPHAFFENGWNQHDPHSQAYWSSLFHGVEGELPQLKKLLRTPNAGSGTTPLAVFALHGTSVLVLAGRVFGEAAAASIFQFRRDRPREKEGGRWGYDAGAMPAHPTKYSLSSVKDPEPGDDEAALIVALTFDLANERLGQAVYENGAFVMPALRLTASGALSADVLESSADLDEVSQLLGDAVRTLQDDWKVKMVHLFVAAPASVAFKVGQKLQARHHAVFRCYEAERGAQSEYKPTIELASTEARMPNTGLRLQLG